MYDGGITTTPSPRWAPRRTAVPPGTIRHGPPARSSRGGTAARSRNVSGPAAQSTRRPVREAGEDRGLDVGPDAPAVGRRSDRARRRGAGPPRGRRGSSRIDRPARSARLGRRRLGLGGHATASRGAARRARSGHRPPRPARAPGASRPSPRHRPARAAGAAPGPCRTRAGPSDAARPSPGPGSGRRGSCRGRAAASARGSAARASQSPASAAAHRRDELARDLVRRDRDDAVAAHREDRQGPGVVAGEDRDVARPVAADPGDLLEVAARLLDRDDARVLGEPQERVGIDVGARSATGRCRRRSAGRPRRRSPGSGRRASGRRAGCSRARRRARHRRRARRPGASRGSWPRCRSCRSRRRPGSRSREGRSAATSTVAAMSRSRSSVDRVGDSPVVPHGTRPSMPARICQRTSRRKAASSRSPSAVNGVTSAVNAPRSIGRVAGTGRSVMVGRKVGVIGVPFRQRSGRER